MLFWDYLLRGGYVMAAIGFCSVLALAFFLERFFFFRKIHLQNFSLPTRLTQKIFNQEIESAISLCEEYKNWHSSLFQGLLIRRNWTGIELQKWMSESIEREILQVENRVLILGTVASIAPLLGLLGTVLGMMDALQVLELSLGLLENQSDFLRGIWTALITTAGGLIVAIPTLAAYNYLLAKTKNLALQIQNQALQMIESLKN